MQKDFDSGNSESTAYQDKVSVNIRLPADIVEILDEVIFYAKKEIGKNKRRKITKSEFYEMVFRDLVNEYKLTGKESRLWKAVTA